MTRRPVDRNVNYMKENWGTNCLITDYGVLDPKKVIQEVMYDPETDFENATRTDLYEKKENLDESEFSYGIEPTYKVGKNQKFLRD